MEKRPQKSLIGVISAAPILYLVGLAVSYVLYLVMPWALFSARSEEVVLWIGAALIVLATGLVFWAQRISRQNSHRKIGIIYAPTCRDFMHGPYRYMRHPGALGLMIMFLGFVLVVNSLVMAILLGLFVIFETFVFIPMEEKVYMAECPDAYTEYRKHVRMWL